METQRQQPPSLLLLATVFVDLVDEEIAAGRWEILSDGELGPVDTRRGKVIQLFADPQSRLSAHEEENDAPLQGSAATA